MSTKTYSTIEGRAYCVTAITPCTVSAQIDGEDVRLLELESEQGIFVAPTREVQVSGKALIKKCFKAAPVSVSGGGVSKRVTEVTSTTPTVTMTADAWVRLNPATTCCTVQPKASTESVTSMQLMITPAQHITDADAWLNGAGWLYGAPILGQGLTYIITLTQIGANIKANITVWGE